MIKFIIFLILIIFTGVVYLPLLIILLPWRRTAGPLFLHYASRLYLKILRVRINSDHVDQSELDKKTVIILSNHVNILDIFLLSSLFKASFVAKIEILYYPLFGQAAWLLGTVFLKRGSVRHRSNLVHSMAAEKNRIISLFPQGTTSPFSNPLPFKKGIFKTILLNNDIIMLPVTLLYENEGEIIWTDNHSLFNNIKYICKRKQVKVRLIIHKKITIDDFQDKSVAEVCQIAQDRVLNVS